MPKTIQPPEIGVEEARPRTQENILGYLIIPPENSRRKRADAASGRLLVCNRKSLKGDGYDRPFFFFFLCQTPIHCRGNSLSRDPGPTNEMTNEISQGRTSARLKSRRLGIRLFFGRSGLSWGRMGSSIPYVFRDSRRHEPLLLWPR